MNNFKKARMDTFFSDKSEPELDFECLISRFDKKIIIKYDTENGHVKYVGDEKGPGHFELYSQEENVRATLHCFEGSWVCKNKDDGGYNGMWKIRISQ